MARQVTRPWETEFKVHHVEGVVETADLRVLKISLAKDEVIPWHWHSAVTDRFVCLEGVLVVETPDPEHCYRLEAGGECLVPPKVAHKVSADEAKPCRFMVIQGVGPYDYQAGACEEARSPLTPDSAYS